MKKSKIIMAFSIISLCVGLVGCGQRQSTDNQNATEEVTVDDASSTEETVEETKATEATEATETVVGTEETEVSAAEQENTLVVYFSATGNTKNIAENIANGLSADIFEVVPEEPYTDADLDYGDDNSRSTVEMNDPSVRPAIAGSVENMEQYDTVYIGYPIWWGEAPRIMSTFVESYDFTDKTIIPFCTSASSGIGSSATGLADVAGSGDWLEGQRFSGNESQDEVMEWVNGL